MTAKVRLDHQRTNLRMLLFDLASDANRRNAKIEQILFQLYKTKCFEFEKILNSYFETK
jgi:hypothetical protein